MIIALAVSVIAIIALVLVPRTGQLAAQAEAAVLQRTLNELRVVLAAKAPLASGRSEALLKENPLDWLEHSLQVVDASCQPATQPPGRWCFESGQLSYRLLYPQTLAGQHWPAGHLLRWRLAVVTGPSGEALERVTLLQMED